MAEKAEVVSAEATRAAHEVRVVFGRLRRRLREIAGVGDLTPSQVSVLSRLDKDGPASASDLAAAERIRPQSMAATLGALAPAGIERLEGDRQARQEWLARALQERFTESERRTVREGLALLDRLTQP